jgi:hypothetical protein
MSMGIRAIRGSEEVETVSGWCPVAAFGISSIEPSGSATRDLVKIACSS